MSRIPIVDCHTHTNFSDGESTFTEVLTAAAANDCRVPSPPPWTRRGTPW